MGYSFSMRHRVLVAFLLTLIAGPACAGGSPPSVLVSIKPVHSLVAAVMEGVGTPALLIGGAASEHSYALKPSDAHKIATAGLVFWIGPDLETFLATPLANLAADAKVIALGHANGVHRLTARAAGLWTALPKQAAGGRTNPHVWLDPDNAIAMTRAIAAALSQADPAHAPRYAANAAKEIGRIGALDRRLAAELAPVRTRPYIVFHDAYPYFEAHYRLNAIAAVTVEPERPVGPRRIATLRDAIDAGKALCIFREPQFSPAVIQTLARGTAARIGVLDPLGADNLAGPDLYPALMSALAGSLVQCLAAPNP